MRPIPVITRFLSGILLLLCLSVPALAEQGGQVQGTNNPSTAAQTQHMEASDRALATKHTSLTESRELPVFLAIGIAINIIMLMVFIAWFVSEWRKHSDRNKR